MDGTATRVKKSIGYQDVGGVFIGKDHYYFEKLEDADISATRYRQNLSFVQKFLTENEDLSAVAMLVPTPGHILEEKLPKGSQLYDDEGMYALAKQTLKGAEFVDCRDTFMEQKEKEIYYGPIITGPDMELILAIRHIAKRRGFRHGSMSVLILSVYRKSFSVHYIPRLWMLRRYRILLRCLRIFRR